MKITNLFPCEIVFIGMERFSYINLPANSLRRNYETSLISADPLCFDLRPVMAAIISCGFVRCIITIRAAENSTIRYHSGHKRAIIGRYIAAIHKRNVSFKVARRGNIDQRYTEL